MDDSVYDQGDTHELWSLRKFTNRDRFLKDLSLLIKLNEVNGFDIISSDSMAVYLMHQSYTLHSVLESTGLIERKPVSLEKEEYKHCCPKVCISCLKKQFNSLKEIIKNPDYDKWLTD